MQQLLQIVFFGLCCFMGTGQDPRTVVVLNLKHGDEVHGHKVQAHRPYIHVLRDGLVRQKTTWPCADDLCSEFDLDGETITFEGISGEPLFVEDSYKQLVPSLREECPELGEVKQPKDAAASLTLDRGRLCAHRAKNGAISALYKVPTTGEVTITGTKNGKQRVLVVKSNAVIELRNEPAGDEITPNHFIAYYKHLTKNSCCTNLPFTPPKGEGCPLPSGVPEVSTVACSNSNYP